MDDSILEINGIRLELDLLDADVLEKYQTLAEQVADRVADDDEYADCATEADRMRKQCRIIDDFFNGLFGEGTANELFPAKNNLGKRIEAFGEVTELATSANDHVAELTEKYGPERLNREQRRAAKYQKDALKANPHDVRQLPVKTNKNDARALQGPSVTCEGQGEAEKPHAELTQEQFVEAMRIAKAAGLLSESD